MSSTLSINDGLFLEKRNVLLPWWTPGDFEELKVVGRPSIQRGGPTAAKAGVGSCDKFLWEDDSILQGMHVSVEAEDYLTFSFYRMYPVGRWCWSKDEYFILKDILSKKFGSAPESHIERELLSTQWQVGDITVGLSMQDHFGIFTNFCVYKNGCIRKVP